MGGFNVVNIITILFYIINIAEIYSEISFIPHFTYTEGVSKFIQDEANI